MSESKIKYQKNIKSRLCRLCIHGRIRRKVGFVCNLSQKPADYYAYCPYFEVFKARDDKIHGNNTEAILERLFFILGFLFFVSMLLVSLDKIFFALFVFALGIIFYSVYYHRLPSKFLPELGWFAFLYLVIIGFVLQKKEFYGEEDILIVKQQIIKLLGRKKISTANEIFKKDSNKIFEFSKYSDKLTIGQKKYIFSMSCQLFVYKNIKTYSSSSLLRDIADFFNLDSDYYSSTKQKYLNAEILFQKEMDNKQKQQQKKKKYNGKRIYSFSSSKYYDILGLKISVSDEQIKKKFKKLALKYHPDKYVLKSQVDQNFALEKFKEISQAYNYLKNLRGF